MGSTSPATATEARAVPAVTAINSAIPTARTAIDDVTLLTPAAIVRYADVLLPAPVRFMECSPPRGRRKTPGCSSPDPSNSHARPQLVGKRAVRCAITAAASL